MNQEIVVRFALSAVMVSAYRYGYSEPAECHDPERRVMLDLDRPEFLKNVGRGIGITSLGAVDDDFNNGNGKGGKFKRKKDKSPSDGRED